MQSNGGLIDLGAAADHAAWTVLSGPAGGAAGAAYVARAAEQPNVLCFDMGGTSCDVCVVDDGAVQERSAGEIADRPLALAMLAVHTVGAGGGSIAWRDPGGALRVGPRSSGAEPGPACYGRGGTEPTVTDANLLLGYLGADAPLAGGVELDRDASARRDRAPRPRARPRPDRVRRGDHPRGERRDGPGAARRHRPARRRSRAATRCSRSAEPGRCMPPRSPTNSGSPRSCARAPPASSPRSGSSSRRVGATSSRVCS